MYIDRSNSPCARPYLAELRRVVYLPGGMIGMFWLGGAGLHQVRATLPSGGMTTMRSLPQSPKHILPALSIAIHRGFGSTSPETEVGSSLSVKTSSSGGSGWAAGGSGNSAGSQLRLAGLRTVGGTRVVLPPGGVHVHSI